MKNEELRMKNFDMKKFFEPLRGKAKKEHYILNIIGCLGLIPISYFIGFMDNFWLVAGLFLLWWFIIIFSYLTFCYIKNKNQ